MMRACVFGSAHGLRRRFLRLDSALCLSLSPLVFNAAVGPPALKFLPVCLCVYVCVVVIFPWRWWTTSGTRRPAGWPDSDLEPCTLSRWVLEAADRVRPWFPTLSANVVCSSGVGALQPRGYLRLSQSWDLERVEPPHRCVNAPQWWAATHIYTNTRSRGLNLQFYF